MKTMDIVLAIDSCCTKKTGRELQIMPKLRILQVILKDPKRTPQKHIGLRLIRNSNQWWIHALFFYTPRTRINSNNHTNSLQNPLQNYIAALRRVTWNSLEIHSKFTWNCITAFRRVIWKSLEIHSKFAWNLLEIALLRFAESFEIYSNLYFKL